MEHIAAMSRARLGFRNRAVVCAAAFAASALAGRGAFAEAESKEPTLVVVGDSVCSSATMVRHLVPRLPNATIRVSETLAQGDLQVRFVHGDEGWSLTVTTDDGKRLLTRLLRAPREQCAAAAAATAFVLERYLRGIGWPGIMAGSMPRIPERLPGRIPELVPRLERPMAVVANPSADSATGTRPATSRSIPWQVSLRLQLAHGVAHTRSQLGVGVDVGFTLMRRVRLRLGVDALLPSERAVSFEDPLGGQRTLGSVTFASLAAFAGVGLCSQTSVQTKLRVCADALLGGQLFYAGADGAFLYDTETGWAHQAFGAVELSTAFTPGERWLFGLYVRGMLIAPRRRFAVEGLERDVLGAGPTAAVGGAVVEMIF